ncbi:MAG: DUF5054 domain-containing protein [Anaerolineae bacterium]|nr:DUF5054 domain-containing protein [Anaerolineae bacterium]
MTEIHTAHVVFKTHLDVGFTDLASNVVQKYLDVFIPGALSLAERTRESSDSQWFRWTTGSWLIYHALEVGSPELKRRIEVGIANGALNWHALPFTTHSEYFDPDLFRFGLGLSHKLDQRFGRHTIAGKMTDVPGHTRAIVPLLVEAGIEWLHSGVNQASSVPEVPSVFTWRDTVSRSQITMAYDSGYGGLVSVPGCPDALALVLTGDNLGPPTESQIRQTFADVERALPGSVVLASTLDDFARALRPYTDQLPVITSEIGDTWIQGVGSDPTKTRHFRVWTRKRGEWLGRNLPDDEHQQVEKASLPLLLVGEHTWGMDEKTHFPDTSSYLGAGFETARQSQRGQLFARSWAEQRDYLAQALAAIEAPSLRDEILAALAASDPHQPDLHDWSPVSSLDVINSRAALRFDASTGAVSRLEDRGTGHLWAEADHPLAMLSYRVFGGDDYARYTRQYLRNLDDPEIEWWAVPDNVKQGTPNPLGESFIPNVTLALAQGEYRRLFVLEYPQAARDFGAPRVTILQYHIRDNAIDIDLSWFEKPACRIAEAFWLSFIPRIDPDADWLLSKLGSWVDPRDVVSKGARALHGADAVRVSKQGDHLALTCFDSALIGVGRPRLLDFDNALPDLNDGFHANLYNNVWGTNFPMWFGDDARFRFTLSFGG